MRPFVVLGFLLGLLLAPSGCESSRPGPVVGPPFGDDLRAALVGSRFPCDEHNECASGVCRFNGCVGALAVDQRWLQEAVARRLGQMAETHPTAGRRIVQLVQDVLAEDEHADVRVVARAAFVVSHVPGAEAAQLLSTWFGHDSLAVRREAALGLAARGDGRGSALLLAEARQPEAQWRA